MACFVNVLSGRIYSTPGCRRNFFIFFKHPVEIGKVGETTVITYTGNGPVFCEKAAGMMNSYFIQEIDIGFSGSCFEIFAKCFGSKVRLGCCFL